MEGRVLDFWGYKMLKVLFKIYYSYILYYNYEINL